MGLVTDSVLVERRFRGPAQSANGGYACGLVAAALEPDPAVEVTLRAPPPIERPMRRMAVDGKLELRDGETVVAEGRPAAAPELAIPDPVSLASAEAAMVAARRRIADIEAAAEADKGVTKRDLVTAAWVAPLVMSFNLPGKVFAHSAISPGDTPTKAPTRAHHPTKAPARRGSPTAASAPTAAPTGAPTEAPTPAPTTAPTSAPSPPTIAPSSAPTRRPRGVPTIAPP